MSAFSPLSSKQNNPITTQEHHIVQTQSVAFNPKNGTHFIPLLKDSQGKYGSVAVSEKTHFKPIKTHNSPHLRSPEIFEPPAIRRKINVAPSIPDF